MFACPPPPLHAPSADRPRYALEALASLGSPSRVDCALRLYVARNGYGIAQPHDLLAELDRVNPGAAGRLRRFGIHR